MCECGVSVCGICVWGVYVCVCIICQCGGVCVSVCGGMFVVGCV